MEGFKAVLKFLYFIDLLRALLRIFWPCGSCSKGITPFPSLNLSHYTILHVPCPGRTAPCQYKCFQRFFFQTLNFRPTAALLGELTHPSWLLFCTGITPSSSSRTRTPASINATPANINLAGQCRPFLVELGYKVLQALLYLTRWSFLQT